MKGTSPSQLNTAQIRVSRQARLLLLRKAEGSGKSVHEVLDDILGTHEYQMILPTEPTEPTEPTFQMYSVKRSGEKVVLEKVIQNTKDVATSEDKQVV